MLYKAALWWCPLLQIKLNWAILLANLFRRCSTTLNWTINDFFFKVWCYYLISKILWALALFCARQRNHYKMQENNHICDGNCNSAPLHTTSTLILFFKQHTLKCFIPSIITSWWGLIYRAIFSRTDRGTKISTEVQHFSRHFEANYSLY